MMRVMMSRAAPAAGNGDAGAGGARTSHEEAIPTPAAAAVKSRARRRHRRGSARPCGAREDSKLPRMCRRDELTRLCGRHSRLRMPERRAVLDGDLDRIDVQRGLLFDQRFHWLVFRQKSHAVLVAQGPIGVGGQIEDRRDGMAARRRDEITGAEEARPTCPCRRRKSRTRDLRSTRSRQPMRNQRFACAAQICVSTEP